MKSALFSILKHPKAKFGILLVVFALWIGFFAEHNLVRHFQDKYKLKQLLDQKEYLQEKIHSDQRKIQELQTNQKNLEKFAREQFLMKKENEDVFVIVEE